MSNIEPTALSVFATSATRGSNLLSAGVRLCLDEARQRRDAGRAGSRQGREPDSDREAVGVDTVELEIHRHTVLLKFTYMSGRGQPAVALISCWQFPVRQALAAHTDISTFMEAPKARFAALLSRWRLLNEDRGKILVYRVVNLALRAALTVAELSKLCARGGS